MKRTLALMAVMAFSGCGLITGEDGGGGFVTSPVEVTLRYGEIRAVEGSILRVSFVAVTGDSRCPTDVECVWQGNAGVEVGIGAATDPNALIRMNTTLEPQSVRWNGVLVTVLELTPDPVSDEEIEPADYTVKLRLEPLR